MAIQFKELLSDKELIDFIVPSQTLTDIEKEVCDRLFAFEDHISTLYNSTTNAINKTQFESIAKDYFNALTL